jgi:vanillate O-demethylase monooxygenase subunit
VILEAQQRAILANPSLKLKAFKIDDGGMRARQIIRRLITAEDAVEG